MRARGGLGAGLGRESGRPAKSKRFREGRGGSGVRVAIGAEGRGKVPVGGRRRPSGPVGDQTRARGRRQTRIPGAMIPAASAEDATASCGAFRPPASSRARLGRFVSVVSRLLLAAQRRGKVEGLGPGRDSPALEARFRGPAGGNKGGRAGESAVEIDGPGVTRPSRPGPPLPSPAPSSRAALEGQRPPRPETPFHFNGSREGRLAGPTGDFQIQLQIAPKAETAGALGRRDRRPFGTQPARDVLVAGAGTCRSRRGGRERWIFQRLASAWGGGSIEKNGFGPSRRAGDGYVVGRGRAVGQLTAGAGPPRPRM